nr:hypothetical protein GCM10020093_032080 [Planobispora longispora]
MDESATHEALARVVREHAGRLAASLVSLLGDFAAAEDLVQDAVEIALKRWPVEGCRSGRTPGCSPWPGGAVWTCCAANRPTGPSWPSWPGRCPPSRTTGCG